MGELDRGQMPYRVINATYTFPVLEHDRFAAYDLERIPMATYLDIDEVADKSFGVPHTLPEEGVLGGHLKRLDVSVYDSVFVYDDFSVLGSTRAWWMFKALGFKSRFLFFFVC